jgi:hypothetical protein
MEQIKQSNQLDSALPYGRRYTHGAPGLYAGGLSPLDALRAPVLPPEDVDPPLLTPPPLLPPPPLAARRKAQHSRTHAEKRDISIPHTCACVWL